MYVNFKMYNETETIWKIKWFIAPLDHALRHCCLLTVPPKYNPLPYLVNVAFK